MECQINDLKKDICLQKFIDECSGTSTDKNKSIRMLDFEIPADLFSEPIKVTADSATLLFKKTVETVASKIDKERILANNKKKQQERRQNKSSNLNPQTTSTRQ